MATYVNYDLPNGKKKRIPQADLDRIINGLKVDQETAIEIWLEDEGILINEEQNELDKKAKDNRITATIHQAKSETAKPRKKVERKADETKESLISGLAEYLAEIVDNVQVVNVGKIIEFDLKGEHYKLDLIRQRKPKK
jgi:hypothetical protein